VEDTALSCLARLVLRGSSAGRHLSLAGAFWAEQSWNCVLHANNLLLTQQEASHTYITILLLFFLVSIVEVIFTSRLNQQQYLVRKSPLI